MCWTCRSASKQASYSTCTLVMMQFVTHLAFSQARRDVDNRDFGVILSPDWHMQKPCWGRVCSIPTSLLSIEFGTAPCVMFQSLALLQDAR
jgi:hypothetical protein